MPARHTIPTVRDLLQLYQQEYLPHKAAHTQTQARSMYKRILNDLGALRLDHLTPDVLRAWRDKLAKTYSPGTVRAYAHVLSAPLTIAVRDYEWLPANPLRKVVLPPVPQGRERYLTREEGVTLLTECQASRSPHVYLMVALALGTGARKDELLTLRWSMVDLTNKLVRFPRTKNGVRRPAPVTGLALRLLRERAEQGTPRGLVFPGKGATIATIDKGFKLAVKRARLGDFRFHDLRHTHASWLAMSGASTTEIAEILGHRTMQMVRRYVHFTSSHLVGIAEKMTREFLPE